MGDNAIPAPRLQQYETAAIIVFAANANGTLASPARFPIHHLNSGLDVEFEEPQNGPDPLYREFLPFPDGGRNLEQTGKRPVGSTFRRVEAIGLRPSPGSCRYERVRH